VFRHAEPAPLLSARCAERIVAGLGRIARLLSARCAERIVAGLRYPVMSNAPITVYTTSWCGYCHRLMTVLKSNGIPYETVDIEHDSAAAEFVGSVNGGNRTVPTVKFADGSTLTNPSAAEVKAKLAQVAG
jgi:mycoredoxin